MIPENHEEKYLVGLIEKHGGANNALFIVTNAIEGLEAHLAICKNNSSGTVENMALLLDVNNQVQCLKRIQERLRVLIDT